MTDDNTLRLRTTASLWIGGVRTEVKLLAGVAPGGRGLYGLISLSACPGVPVASFRLEGGRIRDFQDVADHGIKQHLAQVFGLPADDVCRYLRDLAVELITDWLARAAGQTGGEALLFSASAFDLLDEVRH